MSFGAISCAYRIGVLETSRDPPETHLEMSFTNTSPLFSAAVRPRADGTLGSSVFASVAQSAAFIQGDVSSDGAPRFTRAS